MSSSYAGFLIGIFVGVVVMTLPPILFEPSKPDGKGDLSPGHIVSLNGVGEVIEHGLKDVSNGEVLLVEGGSVFVRVERSDILKFKLEDVTRE